MDPAPRVQALVPVWNSRGFLTRTLELLAAQTWPALSVLVSDDASPDDTAEVAERFAAGDPRFRVVRQPRNLGWVGNVNVLLSAANAGYLLFAFQDDLLEPTYVERCVRALESDPGAVMAFSDIRLVHPDGRSEPKRYPELDGITDRLARARRIARQDGSWWIPNRGVFRAGAARAIGGLRRHAAGEFSADWPWLLEMSLLGGFVRVPDILVTKIYQPRSLSRTWHFGARSWLAVTASARRALAHRRLPARERLPLEGTLAGFAARQVRRSIRSHVGRALRRAGLRRGTEDPGDAGPGTGRS